ncbi:MAG: phosphatidylglycerol lysyltransferase domain-containing protein, partial [Pseudomonadota bacterium]
MTEPGSQLNSEQETVFDRAPKWLSTLAFLAGAVTLISAAIPSGIVPPQKPLLRLLAEAPAITLSVGGLALMVLSLGLSRRMYTAWALTTIIAVHGVFATLFLRPRFFELVVYLALLAVLLIARKGFYRRSSLFTIIIPRLWILASLFILAVASFIALLWVSHQKGFVEANFVDLLIDPYLGVAGRPIAVAGIVLGLGVLYFGIASPIWTRPDVANPSDFQHIAQLLQESDQARPDNVLAYTGDKSIFYGPDRRAALAYMDYGGSRIAMGPPIGPQTAWKETLQSFRKNAEADGLRPAVYAAPPDLLP